MTTAHRLRDTTGWLGGAVAAAGAAYLADAGWHWLRYGVVAPPAAAESDPLLDAFMPDCDVVERHHAAIDAPAAVTLGAARDVDVMGSGIARAIFRGRAVILGSTPDRDSHPRRLVDFVRSLGWELLAEVPGRELVFGAATKPWEPDVTFRPIRAPFFAAFDEPGYVKIIWTLRADPAGEDRSIFRTETRAVATDADARARFRLYWALLSPGIRLIRQSMLGPVKREAERRAQACARPATSA